MKFLTGQNGREQTILLSAAATLWASLGIGYFYWCNMSRRLKSKGQSLESDDHENSTHVTPSQALQLIVQRRSIFPKQYSSEKVPRAVLDDMLEAARWAPSHRLTQAWHFVLFETMVERAKLGHFLANQYRDSCHEKELEFSQRKYVKRITQAARASYVLALCVKLPKGVSLNTDSTNPAVLEEVCSVACAVQNMHLVASAHKVGAYWSSAVVVDSQKVLDFLELSEREYLFLGWMYVGAYDTSGAVTWPKSPERKPYSVQVFENRGVTTDSTTSTISSKDSED